MPLINKCVDLKAYQSLDAFRNQQLHHCINTLPKLVLNNLLCIILYMSMLFRDTSAAFIRVCEWSAEMKGDFGQWDTGVGIDTQLERRSKLIERVRSQLTALVLLNAFQDVITSAKVCL